MMQNNVLWEDIFAVAVNPVWEWNSLFSRLTRLGSGTKACELENPMIIKGHWTDIKDKGRQIMKMSKSMRLIFNDIASVRKECFHIVTSIPILFKTTFSAKVLCLQVYCRKEISKHFCPGYTYYTVFHNSCATYTEFSFTNTFVPFYLFRLAN